MSSLLLLFAAFVLVLFMVVCQFVLWSLLEDEYPLMRRFLPPAGLDKQEKYKSHPGENCSFLLREES